MIRRIIISLSALFISTVACKADGNESLFELANEKYSEGLYAEAIESYEEILSSGYSSSALYYNLGNAYSFMGMYDKAIRNYRKALEINPDFAGAFYNLGSTYAKKDMLDEAIRAYQRALQINPYFIEAHYKLGTIYYHRKQYNLSARHFKIMERLGYPIPLEFREMLREHSK